jgi:hypothetical protein
MYRKGMPLVSGESVSIAAQIKRWKCEAKKLNRENVEIKQHFI